MGLFRKLFGKSNQRHDAFHRNLVALVAEQEIDLILDVGANQGQYAGAMFDLGYQGRIVSFEPGAAAHAALLANAAGNPRWVVAPRMALGRKREMLTLHTFNRTDMNSLLPPTADAFGSFPKLSQAGAEEVQVERLDEVIENFPAGRRILLKVDTQGAELAVIEGAAGCLDRIAMLQLEVPVVPVYEAAPAWMDILRPVHESGFRPVLTAPGYFAKRINRQLDMDIVFLRPPGDQKS